MVSLNENLWNTLNENLQLDINEGNCWCNGGCVCNLCDCNCFDCYEK